MLWPVKVIQNNGEKLNHVADKHRLHYPLQQRSYCQSSWTYNIRTEEIPAIFSLVTHYHIKFYFYNRKRNYDTKISLFAVSIFSFTIFTSQVHPLDDHDPTEYNGAQTEKQEALMIFPQSMTKIKNPSVQTENFSHANSHHTGHNTVLQKPLLYFHPTLSWLTYHFLTLSQILTFINSVLTKHQLLWETEHLSALD